MTQLSMMDAVDAALPHGTACGSWWWHAWRDGDAIPPGWRPPAPGTDYPKPRLPAGSPVGTACEGDEIDMEVAKAVDAWLPAGMVAPFVGIHETKRLPCGGAWACLEAWDRGLSHATVRDGLIEWGHVPGAGALVAWKGTTEWGRLPAEEAWDEEAQAWGPRLHWSLTWKPGDAVPPGYTPPIAGAALPGWQASHGGTLDENIASDVWAALWASHPPSVPFPLDGFVETHVFPDGALWASMMAITDGGLCHVVLRDGQIELSEAPGAGLLVWMEDARTWGRLPAKDRWDAEAEAWVPRTASTEAVSAPADVEALETSASDLPDVAPEPAAPAEAAEEGGSEDEFPDVDPVYGTRPVPPAPPDFVEKLLRTQKAARIARWELWKPMDALEEAGLATIRRRGQQGTNFFHCHIELAPAVSDLMTLRYSQRSGIPNDVTLQLLPGADPESEIVRQVEAILGLTAQPAGNPRPATGGAG